VNPLILVVDDERARPLHRPLRTPATEAVSDHKYPDTRERHKRRARLFDAPTSDAIVIGAKRTDGINKMSWADAIADINSRFVPGRPDQAPQLVDAEAATTALPPFARERLIALRQRAADLRASIEAAQDQRDGAQTQFHELDKALKRLLAPFAREGFQQNKNSPEVVRVRGQLTAAQERRARASDHVAKLSAQWQPLKNLVDRLDAFVIGGGIKQPFVGRVSPPPNGETPTASVKRLRATIAKLRADLAAVEKAPVPLAIAVQRAREQVAALAREGRPQVEPLFQRDDRFAKLAWPSSNERMTVFGDVGLIDGAPRRVVGFAAGDLPQSNAMIAWLFEDRLQERVADLIKQSANEKAALTVEAQRQRRADLAAELLLIERQEIAAIERGEAEGGMIGIRVDTDPRAVLHLS
jgi:hypothetical protein